MEALFWLKNGFYVAALMVIGRVDLHWPNYSKNKISYFKNIKIKSNWARMGEAREGSSGKIGIKKLRKLKKKGLQTN